MNDQKTATEQVGKTAPATTPSGRPITCDGCGSVISREEVTEAMTSPIPDEISVENYGRAGLVYIVCQPLPAGQPCLVQPRAAFPAQGPCTPMPRRRPRPARPRFRSSRIRTARRLPQ